MKPYTWWRFINIKISIDGCFQGLKSTFCLRFSMNRISVLYKPDAGLLKEQWITSNGVPYTLYQLKDKIKGYPDCPGSILNEDKFEFLFTAYSKYQDIYYRFKAFFISPTTGSHKLFANCQQECQLDIELPPNYGNEAIYISSPSAATK